MFTTTFPHHADFLKSSFSIFYMMLIKHVIKLTDFLQNYFTLLLFQIYKFYNTPYAKNQNRILIFFK
jgi:hypothetical protein